MNHHLTEDGRLPIPEEISSIIKKIFSTHSQYKII